MNEKPAHTQVVGEGPSRLVVKAVRVPDREGTITAIYDADDKRLTRQHFVRKSAYLAMKEAVKEAERLIEWREAAPEDGA